MLKRKTNIFVTILFTFVAFMLIGTTNVNATTVTVTNEQELIDALDGVKEVEGSKVTDTDTDTTVVELSGDITLTNNLTIYAITDLTLDLKGHTIDGKTNSKSVIIYYAWNAKESFPTGSLTIKDTGSGVAGKIISYSPIGITTYSGKKDIPSCKLIIDDGEFYNIYYGTMFEIRGSNLKLDFIVNDGYFECSDNYAIFLNAGDMLTDNITLNVKIDKLTMKGGSTRLVYSAQKDFKISDVVSESSNIRLKHSITNTEGVLVDDRTLSVTEYMGLQNAVGFYFDTIEITKKEGFDVSDVTLNETYGYTSTTAKPIAIKNRGANALQVKSVEISGENASNFTLTGSTQPIISSGETNSGDFSITPVTGLNAGEYTATIIVTDINDNTYTATVTLKVEKQILTGITISQEGWKYDGTAHTSYTLSGLGSLSSSQYKIEYFVSGEDSWSETAPKTVGNYTIRLTVTDPNLTSVPAKCDFEIKQNDTQIKIVANSNSWTYDGNSHSDNGYKVFYGDTEVTTEVLPTGDAISAVVNGSVKDTLTANNKITGYTIANRECYSNVISVDGTLTIKPITAQIVVTADSDTKPYTGSALTKNTYTFTDGVLVPGDTLDVTISGEQTYVGQSENKVESVKVMRGNEDITSNYRFGAHVNGTLKITPVDQPLSIVDQYVTVNGTLSTAELEQALSGAEGNVSFEVKSGTAGTYNDELYGGFLAGASSGDVTMTVKATAFDVNNDGTPEYNATEKDFVIHVVTKETVAINGPAVYWEFFYDGTPKTSPGVLAVTGNKVDTGTLEVSYAGIEGTVYSGETAPKEVGKYTVTYKVPDSNPNYMGTATFTFKIKKVQLPEVELAETSFEYTGSEISIPAPASFSGELMTSSGYINGTEVNTYTITVGLRDKNNYMWNNGTTADLTLTWYITKATPTIEISNLSQKVGSVVEPTYTVTPAVTSGDVTVEYKLSTADASAYTETLPTDAGTYSVRVSVSGDKNLNNTSKVETLTITKTTTGGGGGGSSTTTYAITVKENENAEITPNGTVKVEKGNDKTFKIKAKEGYEIEDVLVDGKGVGAVSKYTFENVKAKHTLEVKVKKVEEKPTTPEVKETFKDVKKDDWYFEAIEYVAKKGLMNGTGNDMFSPDATTTRGMIVTILYRLEGEPAVEECSFTDVPSDAYYAKAIAWAEKNGIVLGLGEGKFGPDEEITREQLATIMYRYSMYKKYDTSVAEDTNILSYNDIQDLAEYAFQAMQYACGEGLISGMGNGNLAPKGNATRAQLATILMRYCEKYMK